MLVLMQTSCVSTSAGSLLWGSICAKMILMFGICYFLPPTVSSDILASSASWPRCYHQATFGYNVVTKSKNLHADVSIWILGIRRKTTYRQESRVKALLSALIIIPIVQWEVSENLSPSCYKVFQIIVSHENSLKK